MKEYDKKDNTTIYALFSTVKYFYLININSLLGISLFLITNFIVSISKIFDQIKNLIPLYSQITLPFEENCSIVCIRFVCHSDENGNKFQTCCYNGCDGTSSCTDCFREGDEFLFDDKPIDIPGISIHNTKNKIIFKIKSDFLIKDFNSLINTWTKYFYSK